MRKLIFSFAFAILAASGALAATPEQEKAFVDAYKTAFEAQNADGLNALLFTEGAIPMAVEFYKSAMTADFGKKISEITLQELTSEETTEVAAIMDTPDGGKAVLKPQPYKKLVIKIDTSDTNGTSSTTNTIFVAEQNGKLGIAMPAPAN